MSFERDCLRGHVPFLDVAGECPHCVDELREQIQELKKQLDRMVDSRSKVGGLEEDVRLLRRNNQRLAEDARQALAALGQLRWEVGIWKARALGQLEWSREKWLEHSK